MYTMMMVVFYYAAYFGTVGALLRPMWLVVAGALLRCVSAGAGEDSCRWSLEFEAISPIAAHPTST